MNNKILVSFLPLRIKKKPHNFENSSIILPTVTDLPERFLATTFAKFFYSTKSRSGPHPGKVSPEIADAMYPPVRTADLKIAKQEFSFCLVVISQKKLILQAPKKTKLINLFTKLNHIIKKSHLLQF